MAGGGVKGASRAAADPELPPLAGGEHVCWVFHEQHDYDAGAATCLAEGRAAGEKLLLFGPESSLAAARSRHPDVTVLDPRSAFLGGGPLDTDAMLQMIGAQAEEAAATGHSGLRLVADMRWLLHHPPAPGELAAFELCLDRAVQEAAGTVVCAYTTAAFGPEHIAAAAAVHPLSAGSLDAALGFSLVSRGEAWAVSGEIDTANADQFAELLQSVSSRWRPVVLDLGDLEFVDVAGLRALAEGSGAAQGARVRLVGASASFRRIWHLLDLTRILPSVEVSA